MLGSPRLLIVADDLTGALDSACEAARRGIGTRVFLSPQALAAAEGDALPPVVAVSTGSRDGSEHASRQAMTQVCACLSWLAPAHVMKKVDSRLKGHVALETTLLAQVLNKQEIVAAPALPDMGRTQQAGMLSGTGIDAPINVATKFEGLEVEVPDIVSPDDMKAAASKENELAVGARSLAEALVTRLWPEAVLSERPLLQAPAIFAIGSRDPITLAQVAQLGLAAIPAPDGQLEEQGNVQEGLFQLFQMVPGPGAPADPRSAGDAFAGALADRFLRQQLPATLIACGGETAGSILSRMGVGHLDVEGTALPGVPVSRAQLADGRTVAVVTKSGGFGGREALAQLAKMVDNRFVAGQFGRIDNRGISA
ncbi:MAG: hypothetical protein FJX25_05180 [Alphaproteobacteria bacterium]|nr:hypothetical protein [Alphaproteobacteria bacterium]